MSRFPFALLYLIFFDSILVFSACVYLLAKWVRPALATSYAYINPIVAMALGVGLVAESISRTDFTGIDFILLGVALVVMVFKSKGHSKLWF